MVPLFGMGQVLFSPAAGQEADSPAVQRSGAPWFQASLIKLRRACSVTDTIVAVRTL